MTGSIGNSSASISPLAIASGSKTRLGEATRTSFRRPGVWKARKSLLRGSQQSATPRKEQKRVSHVQFGGSKDLISMFIEPVDSSGSRELDIFKLDAKERLGSSSFLEGISPSGTDHEAGSHG